MNFRNLLYLIGLILLLLLSACSTSRQMASMDDMESSSLSPEDLMEIIPDYRKSLTTLAGNGRAIVSEPDGSERVTLQFSSNREKSLITIRTSVGIEGGQILVDSDSLLVYNRVDKIAEKVSLTQSNLTNIGSLASLNMLDMFNFTLNPEQVDQIFEDDEFILAVMDDRTEVTVSKSDGLIQNVVQKDTGSAYSRIDYEGYAQINDFYLPRKITILSSDGRSKATFLVRQMEVNSELPPLEISIPDNITIRRI